MRTPLILVALLPRLVAGEISVVTPTGDSAAAIVESITSGEALNKPKPTLTQEGQLNTFTFNDVKPGRYRVIYLSLDNPMGFNEVLMETLVTVSENSISPVYLFRRAYDQEQIVLPKDVENFLLLHHNNLLELTAVYDGSKIPFNQARGGAWAIRYLRNDCEYHLKVWNHSFRDFPKDPKTRVVIFERSFRIGAREQHLTAPGGVPEAPTEQSEQSEQAGAGQPATSPESKPERGENLKPESEPGPR